MGKKEVKYSANQLINGMLALSNFISSPTPNQKVKSIPQGDIEHLELLCKGMAEKHFAVRTKYENRQAKNISGRAESENKIISEYAPKFEEFCKQHKLLRLSLQGHWKNRPNKNSNIQITSLFKAISQYQSHDNSNNTPEPTG